MISRAEKVRLAQERKDDMEINKRKRIGLWSGFWQGYQVEVCAAMVAWLLMSVYIIFETQGTSGGSWKSIGASLLGLFTICIVALLLAIKIYIKQNKRDG